MLYLDGKGVPRDYVPAYMWSRLADVEPNLTFPKAHMTRTNSWGWTTGRGVEKSACRRIASI